MIWVESFIWEVIPGSISTEIKERKFIQSVSMSRLSRPDAQLASALLGTSWRLAPKGARPMGFWPFNSVHHWFRSTPGNVNNQALHLDPQKAEKPNSVFRVRIHTDSANTNGECWRNMGKASIVTGTLPQVNRLCSLFPLLCDQKNGTDLYFGNANQL